MKLNYERTDKVLIEEAENKRGYSYYEFTEESIKSISKKELKDVTSHEWRSLLQMLYPQGLICSGLFEPLLVFKIENGKRIDPPYEHWFSIDEKGSNGIPLERFISALEGSNISVNESWKTHLVKAKKKSEEKP